MKITLEDVFITSYNTGGSAHSDVVPTEQVTLNFARLELSYKEQKPDGSLGTETKAKYDFALGKVV